MMFCKLICPQHNFMLPIEIIFTRIFLIKSAADMYPGSSMRAFCIAFSFVLIFPPITVYQIWSWHSIQTELNVYIHLANSGRAYRGNRMCKPEILLFSWRYSHIKEIIPCTNTIIPGGHCTEFAYEACCHHILATCCCCG